MTTLTLIGPHKVRISSEGVASFNRGWPCSELRASRAYWFEFDEAGDLVDTDVPHSDDGSAAAAMSEDCKAFLFEAVAPSWAPDAERLPEGAEEISPDGVPFYVADTADSDAKTRECYAFAVHADGETDGDNILGPFETKAEAYDAAMKPGAWKEAGGEAVQ